MHLRFAIHVTEQATSLRAGYPPLFVHPHAAHERHVEHKPPVGRGQTCDVVSPTFDAEQKIVFARELHTRNHIGGAEAARDDGGLSVDHRVSDGSGLLIADVARCKHWPPQTHLQTAECLRLQVDLATLHRFRYHSPRSFLHCA